MQFEESKTFETHSWIWNCTPLAYGFELDTQEKPFWLETNAGYGQSLILDIFQLLGWETMIGAIELW